MIIVQVKEGENIERALKKFKRKFYEDIVRTEVDLSLLADPQNKNVKVHVFIPGNELVVERNNDTFEGAVNDCVSTLKDLLVSEKERRFK